MPPELSSETPPSRERSALMARVRGRDTKPEVTVRRALNAMGKRFRLFRRDLPGRPDIVLPRYGLALFVHGCFWHRHEGCRLSSTPKTRVEFWAEKFAANIARDARSVAELRALGWRVGVIWECETRRPDLTTLLARLLKTAT